MLEIKSVSSKETKMIGNEIAKLVKPGHLICIDGEMGAGKTVITQGIVYGLGVVDYVTSPTYTIVNEYLGDYKVYHFDVYRLSDIDELLEIGFEEYLSGDAVVIIEWSSLIKEILPDKFLYIKIDKSKDIEHRTISISGYGKEYAKIEEKLSSL